MRIAVIGAGQVRSTLGRRWTDAGHEVTFGLRRAEQHAPRLGEQAPGADARPVGDAIAGAEAVLLAVPGAAVEDIVREHARPLAGKVIIDATNRLDREPANGLAALAAHAPSARGFRAFNSLAGSASPIQTSEASPPTSSTADTRATTPPSWSG